MRFQDSVIEATRYAAQEAFKYAKAVPTDRLEWKPMDTGRTVLDICQEMALCSQWSEDILSGKGVSVPSEEDMTEMHAATSHLTTVEACEAECMKRLESFFAVVRDFPDDRLSEKYVLPFDGGHEITMMENIMYPQWNYTYHQGQIAYIQTLYGDKKMYW